MPDDRESHWGDLAGEPLLPPRCYGEPPRPFPWLSALGFVLMILAAIFVFVVNVYAADERQIRRDCTWDALRYCKASIPQGRQFIIVCMVANRDKLQVKCSKHFY